ncbi:MAG: hypothetical protein U0625_01205 [Phycisphaerales bacterium]
MELDLLLRAVLGPAAASAAALVALRLLAAWLAAPRAAGDSTHSTHPARRARIARALASPLWLAPLLAVPPIAAFIHQEGEFTWPPLLAFGWLPVAIALAGVLAPALLFPDAARRGASARADADPPAVAHAPQGGDTPAWGLATGGCALLAIVSMVVLPAPGHADGVSRLVAAAIAAVAACGAACVARRPGIAGFVAPWGCAAALSAMALLGGFIKLAVILGALSATSAGFAVLARWLRLAPGAAGAAAFACILAACAFLGMGYDERHMPVWSWAIVALAPAAGSLAALPAIARRPRLEWMVRAGAPIAVAALGVACGALLAPAPAQEEQEVPDAYRSLGARSVAPAHLG